MKTLKISFLSLAFFSCLSISLFADTSSVTDEASFMLEIENYISTLDYTPQESVAMVYTDFLVKDQEGFIYKIDFIISDNCELIVISTELEEEYYSIDHYNVSQLKTSEVAIAEAKLIIASRA